MTILVRYIRKKLASRELDRTGHPSSLVAINSLNKWTRVPFVGNVSFQIARVLRSFNFRTAYYSFDTLKSNLSKLVDAYILLNEKSGVSIQFT